MPKEIFELKVAPKIGGVSSIDKMRFDMFRIYKEHKIESLFYGIYCKYFFFQLIPEFIYSDIHISSKIFCYAYSLDEGDRNKNFYSIMNRDLRSGDSAKIEKYLEIISLLNRCIKLERIKSFEGKLFRGTQIDEEYIKNKFIKGKILTNLSFWSASKSREVSYRFLKNILFIVSTRKNNIDMDAEKISRFEDEKEVLFLPYSKFLIKDKRKIHFNGKEVYEVELEGIDDKHERENISSDTLTKEDLYALYEIVNTI